MSLAETNLFKTGVAAQRPCGGAAVHDYPGATAWKRSGHRGTTQDDPHSNLTFIQSEDNDRMTALANNTKLGKNRRIATFDRPALSSPEVT
jgi:hypothetical protein